MPGAYGTSQCMTTVVVPAWNPFLLIVLARARRCPYRYENHTPSQGEVVPTVRKRHTKVCPFYCYFKKWKDIHLFLLAALLIMLETDALYSVRSKACLAPITLLEMSLPPTTLRLALVYGLSNAMLRVSLVAILQDYYRSTMKMKLDECSMWNWCTNSQQAHIRPSPI
jgi:hypothetical protein